MPLAGAGVPNPNKGLYLVSSTPKSTQTGPKYLWLGVSLRKKKYAGPKLHTAGFILLLSPVVTSRN